MLHKDSKGAIALFESILESRPEGSRALVSARLGSRLAQLEAMDYPRAISFYRFLILRSPNADERKSAQQYIAQIYFENLQDYAQAVIEYERLLSLGLSPAENYKYRLNLAKSHFQLNNLEQVGAETDLLLDQKLDPDEIFEVRVLKANVLVAAKKLPEAAAQWQQIMKDFPERSRKESMGLNLVVCYEEMKDFSKAIETLEKMRADYPNPDFLDLRIARLKERKSNQPGAQGWKR